MGPVRRGVARAIAACLATLTLTGCSATPPPTAAPPTALLTVRATLSASRPPEATRAPLRVDPRCAVFLEAADLDVALGVPATGVTFVDSGLRPPPLIEITCAWALADGSSIRLEVDDLLWNDGPALADEVRHGQSRATPVAGLGDLAFGFQDVAGTTVAWAIRHGGADRTLRLHAGTRPADLVLALAARVHGDASPDLWVADLHPVSPSPDP